MEKQDDEKQNRLYIMYKRFLASYEKSMRQDLNLRPLRPEFLSFCLI
jgi:hypothetical protein